MKYDNEYFAKRYREMNKRRHRMTEIRRQWELENADKAATLYWTVYVLMIVVPMVLMIRRML